MEEPVNTLGGVGGISQVADLMREVAAAQRETLARSNLVARLRGGPPVSRVRPALAARIMQRIPRMRFTVPALAAVGALAIWWSLQPVPLTFAIGAGGVGSIDGLVGQTIVASRDRKLPVHFSDGSRVTLDRGARIQIAALDGRGATLHVEKGRAEVDVRHRSQTNWKLQAGSFEVRVTGTRFSIDWNDSSEALTVLMSEGTVEVRGNHLAGGSPIVVTAGQKFHATAREPRWTLASVSPPAQAVAPVVAANATAGSTESGGTEAGNTTAAPSEAPPASEAPSPRSGTAPGAEKNGRSWQALARAGRYQEALKQVERTGFDRACSRLGAEDLVQLGDAARLARNPARAEQAYRVARRRFPAVDRPAFALGLVAFEQRRDFRTAAKWFDLYARKYPNGPLAREAVGREMESWHRAGDASRARHAARDYLEQAPTGPYAPLARQIAAP